MIILIHVYDDGDTEIRQVEKIPDGNTDLAFYSIEDAARELKDYGFDEDRIDVALRGIADTTDWIEV